MSTPPAKKFHPLLIRFLAQLALHPLRTKALTAGTLFFLQEVLGSNLAGVPVHSAKDSSPIVRALASTHVNLKALKMGLYGFLISAPLSHYLVAQLQKAFAGKTSPAAKVGQFLSNSFVVAPIQTAACLASMAVINGATSLSEVNKTIKAGFFSVIRVTWVVSPVSLAIAQNLLPVELWVPFFNAVQFAIGTYFNYRAKQLRLAAIRKEEKEKQDRDNQGPSQ